MNLRQMKEYLDNLIKYEPINRDYEFDANLENHPIGNQNIYRLYYINYHRINEVCSKDSNNIGVIDIPYKPFMLPKNMNREDGFKVLSYLTDYIERVLELEPFSWESVKILNQVIDLERLGFTRVNIDGNSNLDSILDLYTVSGRLLLFKKSKHYSRYFEWYTKGVTFEEVKSIYESIGIEFYDLNVVEKETKRLICK